MNLPPLLPIWMLVACGLFAPVARSAEATQNAAALYKQAEEHLPKLSPKEQRALYPLNAEDQPSLPIPETARALLPSLAPTLALLEQAANAPSPGAGESQLVVDTGAWLILPGLPLTQSLLDLEARQETRAVARIRAALLTSRRLQSSASPLIHATLSTATELSTQKFIVALLPRFSPPALEQFDDLLRQLPATPTLERAAEYDLNDPALSQLIERLRSNTLTETDHRALLFLESFPSDADLAAQVLRIYHGDLRRLIPLLKSSSITAYRNSRKFLESLETQRGAHHLSPSSLKGYVAVLKLQVQRDIQLAMIQTAIAIHLHGPEAVEQSRDPFTGKPFAYAKARDGFTLTSGFLKSDKPLSLTFQDRK